MNSISTLLFRELASRHSVVLPGIGTLGVTRHAAELKNRRQLVAPCYVITFTRQELPGVSTLPELIARTEEESLQAAQERYRTWLESAQENGKQLQIEGVGCLKSGFFTPDPKLEKRLNPLGTDSVKLRPRSNQKVLWITIPVVLLLCAAGYYGYNYYQTKGTLRPQMAQTSHPITHTATLPTDTVATSGSSVVSDTTVTEKTIPITDSSATATHATPPVTQNPSLSAANPYHVVGGVYSTEANADKAIAKLVEADPTLRPAKVPFRGSKILVSLFSSSDYRETVRMRTKLAKQLHSDELWIYPQNKQ